MRRPTIVTSLSAAAAAFAAGGAGAQVNP